MLANTLFQTVNGKLSAENETRKQQKTREFNMAQ